MTLTTFDSTFEPNGRERRRNERFNISCKVQWKQHSEPGSSWRDEEMLDLSVSGAAFTCAESIEVGKRLTLRITPPDVMPDQIMAQPVLIHCVLRNQQPMGDGKFRSGVEFDRIYFLFAEWVRLVEANGK